VGGKSTPQLSLNDCTGCGACIAPCPVDAIQISRKNTQ
jgi:ferredoxin-type protein NapF